VFGAGGGGGLRSSLASRTISAGYSEMIEGAVSRRGDAALLKTLEGEDVKGSVEGGGSGGGGGGGGGGGFGGSRMTAANRYVDGVEVVGDEVPDHPRRDIELICISSDEDEDAGAGREGKQKDAQRTSHSKKGLRPVRAPHTPREKDGHVPPGRGRPSTDTRAAAAAAVKKSESDTLNEGGEEAEDETAMDVDEPKQHNRLSSPEMRRRNLRKSSSAKSRDSVRAATETIEERAERLRVTDDTNKLRDIFLGRREPRRGRSAVVVDEDDMEDDNDDDDRGEEATLEDGKLFLFQLPPLTPFLYDPTTEPPADPAVKKEPDTAGIKKEGEAAPTSTSTSTSRPALQHDGIITASEPTRLPAGLVGKLRVHASGKVSLDWGGTDMEVRYGTEVDFLQDAVLIQTKNTPTEKEKEKEKGAKGGIAGPGENAAAVAPAAEKVEEDDEDLDLSAVGRTYALGQVRRKMVLIPDWTKLYD